MDETTTYGHDLAVRDATTIGPKAGEGLLGVIGKLDNGRIELVGAVEFGRPRHPAYLEY